MTTTLTTRLVLDWADIQVLLGAIHEARSHGLIPACDAAVEAVEARLEAAENRIAATVAATA